MRYKIAGKTFHFINEDNQVLDSIISKLLYFYESDKTTNTDIIIKFVKGEIDNTIEYSNPKIHGELSNGFIFDTVYGKVAFSSSEGIPQITMALNMLFYANTILSRFISSGEYSSLLDKLSSVLFENVIVPATFFFDDIALIHSAGICNSNKEAILLGGTGGIGKTSMEIELCYYADYGFVNDDIAIVNANGEIYPNYAYPKIYGYNFEGYPALKKDVFSQRSFIDKFAWKYKKMRNGIDRVRRKISPALFNAESISTYPLKSYFLMSRHNSNEFLVKEINAREAAIHTQFIINSEYGSFYNHLIWHAYNAEMTDKEPLIDIHSLNAKKIDILEKAFNHAIINKVLIPKEIKHKEYLKKMRSIISK